MVKGLATVPTSVMTVVLREPLQYPQPQLHCSALHLQQKSMLLESQTVANVDAPAVGAVQPTAANLGQAIGAAHSAAINPETSQNSEPAQPSWWLAQFKKAPVQ